MSRNGTATHEGHGEAFVDATVDRRLLHVGPVQVLPLDRQPLRLVHSLRGVDVVHGLASRGNRFADLRQSTRHDAPDGFLPLVSQVQVAVLVELEVSAPDV